MQPANDDALDLYKRNLQTVLERCVTETFVQHCTDSSLKVSHSDGSNVSASAYEYLAILTLSSFGYRMSCHMYYNLCDESRRFIVDKNYTSLKDDAIDERHDFFQELLNSLFGTLKRKIQANSPPVGLSSPCLLSSRAASFSDDPTFGIAVTVGDQAKHDIFLIEINFFSYQKSEVEWLKSSLDGVNSEEGEGGVLELF